MDLDTLEWVVTSPVFVAAVLAAMATGLTYSVFQIVWAELGFFRFMRQHGFRREQTASTMWLARAVEHLAALRIYGQWDGLPVTVDRPRRGGLTITVTADRDIVSAQSGGRVTLGAWTHPEPPALLRSLRLDASGRQLRLHMGNARDLAPYVSAAVDYARALAGQPVEHSGSGRTP
jgi:hypothetical protein